MIHVMNTGYRPIPRLLAALLMVAPAAHAGVIIDPKPQMSWDDLMRCELVFTATYHSHEGEFANHNRSAKEIPAPQKLTLTVTESLKGALSAGQNVTIQLEHWYGLSTKPTSFLGINNEAKDDGLPRLCYQRQMSNPGGLRPYELVANLRKPALFFVVDASKPALERSGQVQPIRFAADWGKALRGEESGRFFLIVQTVDEDRSMRAIDRLDREHDRAVVEALFGELSFPHFDPENGWRAWSARSVLDKLTDVDGWIFERAKQGIENPPPAPASTASGYSKEWSFERMVRGDYANVMAKASPERAVQQVREWLDADSLELRLEAFNLLRRIPTLEALKLAVELAGKPQTASQAAGAIHGIFSPITNNYLPVSNGYLAAPVWNDLMAILDLPREHWATSDPEQSLTNRSTLRILAALRDQRTPVVLSEAEIAKDERELDAMIAQLPENMLLDTGDWDVIGKVHARLARWRRASDFRVVPPLARLVSHYPMRKYGGSLDDTVRHYLTLDEETVRNGFKAQNATLWGIRGCSMGDRSDDFSWLEQPFPAERGRRLASDPVSLAHVRGMVDGLLAGPNHSYDYEYVEIYHWMLPGEAAKALDALLENRAQLKAYARRKLLRTAVHCGRADLADEMIAAYRLTVEERERALKSEPELVETGYLDVLPLLEAGTQEGLGEYLRLLDQRLEEPPPPVHQGGFRYPPLYAYSGRSLEPHHLFPRYPKPYFARVIRLLQSPKRIDRRRAVAAMRAALHWDGGLDSDGDISIGYRRDRLLARLLPALQRMAQMESELEIRAEILRQIGLDLEGEPGPAWYPELVDAVGSLAPPPLTYNAMRLAELLVRDIGPTSEGLDRDFSAADRAGYLQLFFMQHSGGNDPHFFQTSRPVASPSR